MNMGHLEPQLTPFPERNGCSVPFNKQKKHRAHQLGPRAAPQAGERADQEGRGSSDGCCRHLWQKTDIAKKLTRGAVRPQAGDAARPPRHGGSRMTASRRSLRRELVYNDSKNLQLPRTLCFSWTKPATCRRAVRLHRGGHSAAAAARPTRGYSVTGCMCGFYLGQPVHPLRHLNGRGLPAPELRVLCSTKRGPEAPRPSRLLAHRLLALPGQSRNSFREPIRERLERRMSNLESRHFWQTNTSGTLDLRILAQDRWIQVWHSLHSIMGRPANGFMQKQVTRSQESSSERRESPQRRELPHRSGAPLPPHPSLKPLSSGTEQRRAQRRAPERAVPG